MPTRLPQIAHYAFTMPLSWAQGQLAAACLQGIRIPETQAFRCFHMQQCTMLPTHNHYSPTTTPSHYARSSCSSSATDASTHLCAGSAVRSVNMLAMGE